MKLFNASQLEQIKQVAEKSKESLAQPATSTTSRSINADLQSISKQVEEYFKDSKAILITSKEELHDYITNVIKAGYAGIDCETTGLDRIKDYIVGFSLYYPGGVECYIPNKHLIPIFEAPYKNQITYEEVQEELLRLVEAEVKLIFANADFDLAMMHKDYGVDRTPIFYYDVILAWRCLKENEKDNRLKVLYNKYVLKGKGDPKTFSDFFPVKLFPYCKPEIAKLYAANDAKITYELFEWQLPYTDKNHPKCKKNHLESIADLIWNVEFPLVRSCHYLHYVGVYIDKNVSSTIRDRYRGMYEKELQHLKDMVDEIIYHSDYTPSFNSKPPFTSGSDFNPNSVPQVKHLLYTIMKLPSEKASTDKEILREMNLPITNQLLKVRSLSTLIGTFTDKLPNSVAPDGRIHAQFKQIGADCVTGDTIIPTADGYFTASELCGPAESKLGEHVDVEDIVIINKDQKYEAAQSVIAYKNYPTIKITTELGFTIEGTYNHPIMTSKYTSDDKSVLYDDAKLQTIWEGRKFKTLSEIQIGDIVEIPCQYPTGGHYQSTGLSLSPVYNNRNADATIPAIYDEDFAEFLGMYHADGSASLREGTYTIALSNDDPDVIQRFDELSYKLFHVKSCRYDKQKDINEVESYINCIRIKDIDTILSHGKQHKKIPDAIWKSPYSVINAYIKGLTLDSSVHFEKSTGRAEWELSIIDELDARLVQMHLASQGILSGWGWNENKDFKSPRLKFNSDNYIRFCDDIGFIETRKVVYTGGCVKNPYHRRRINNSFRVSVKSIEYKTNDVYDLHVPETHSFISNGIISHNTGRMSSAEPNLQNIPSHATDIRHMFRATPGYVMMSSDYSQQEPKLTAFIGNIEEMIEGFGKGQDAYAMIASVAYGVPYEECLEFHPETHEYQPEGKARRSESKTILLGVCYGRSIQTIAEQLCGTRDDMTEEEKLAKAQSVFDAVMDAFPGLRNLMNYSQQFAREHGYVETILGRRRHIPDMQLPEFEFKPMKGYVNPDIDPLDITTLDNKSEIPERIQNQLLKEFKGYKYFGQIVKATKRLAEENIKVVNNRTKINEATRQCVNSRVQGSAADLTKLAILRLDNNPDWKRIGGRFLIPVHDELICEVPMEYAEEGAKILSDSMCEAGSFLPFEINCDVETTLRWYGLPYPCPFEKPKSLSDTSTNAISWLQYCIVECEYLLPVYKDENGDKPLGIAARGVNGIDSAELRECIQDYIKRWNIHEDEFLDHIENMVFYGDRNRYNNYNK